MHCSPEQVDDLLKKLKLMQAQVPPALPATAGRSDVWQAGYSQAMSDSIAVVMAIFGTE